MRNAANRLQLEHEVERGHFQRADIVHAQPVGHMLDRRTAQPALLLLRAPQKRDDRACLTPLGVFADLRLGPLLIGRGEGKACGLLVVKTA